MNFFLAVIFFCSNGQCYFWKSDELFYDKDKCQATLEAASKALEDQKIKNQGVCLPLTTKNNVKW